MYRLAGLYQCTVRTGRKIAVIRNGIVDTRHTADIIRIGRIKPLVDLVAAVIRGRIVQKGDLPGLTCHDMGVYSICLKVGAQNLYQICNISVGSRRSFLVVGSPPVPLRFI